ncbi:cytochrome P450 26A1-like [Ischnura elegans]|uniref:cytochrome P450 26A1-like n=1 Tax=Ischnura elegans TaxID=197161 RepID=UPI001ED86F33|nr:cytochrome P450 26A1-like [Ischnura elegans]XP_046386248.1 cytochrome P450 26A1-like [Ischnura elegans]
MSKVPGSTGHVILGDKSLDFGKCPLDFVERLSSQYKSPIFMTRLLLKPTVVVASNSAIRELLYEKEDHFDRGLREQCLQLFGDNVLLVDGEDAQRFRDILKPLLHPDCILNYKEKALSVFHHWSSTLPTGQPIDMYKEFKILGMNLTLRIFLDIDPEISSKLAEDILALSITHWHGLISVPINVKVPLVLSSAYRRAMDAKEQLLTIITEKMDAQNAAFVEELRSHCDDVEFVQSHLLLFISALIPKAVASILSSFLASSQFWLEAFTAERSADGPDVTSFSLYHIMMEVCRLWPPFVGGYRVANRDTTLGGYLIEKGRTVLYVCAPAHREPDLFPRPDEFDPLRWTTCNAGDEDKMFTFGGGSRGCLGKNMILDILMVIAEAFMVKFDWDIVGSSPGILGFSLSNPSSGSSSPIKMKSLPITRPKAPLELILTRKDGENVQQNVEGSSSYCPRGLFTQMSWDCGNAPS